MANDYSTMQQRPKNLAVGSDMESVLLMMHVMKEQIDSIQNTVKGRMETVDSVKEHMTDFERFVRRRFDEISMEINATSQQLDMAEAGFGGRFAEILNTLAAISFSGTGSTAANTGVELEAVIADTEHAANRILDAADRISQHLLNDNASEDLSKETRSKLAMDISVEIQEILMACAFQDVTGQRIRKTLESIHSIEDSISETLGQLGIETKAPDAQAGGVEDSTAGHATSQADIDALFG